MAEASGMGGGLGDWCQRLGPELAQGVEAAAGELAGDGD